MKDKTILICDDDPDILEMLELVLGDSGYNIVLEQNSLNLPGLLEKSLPDLILLDLWMPFLSGDQVLKIIRGNSRTKDLPVIIISASREGKQIADSAGATAFMAKPFDFDDLIVLINQYVL